MISLVMGDYPPEVKSRAIDNLKLFLPTKWAALKKSDELTKSVDELMRSSKTWIAGMQLIAAAQLVDRADRLEGIAIKPEDAEIRTAAIRTLGQLHSPKAVEILVRLTDRGGSSRRGRPGARTTDQRPRLEAGDGGAAETPEKRQFRRGAVPR